MEPEPSHSPPDRSSTGSSLSSGLSMAGPGPQDATRRRLLLIYIHGFNGSETTFLDLPVHIHSALAALLSESHVVYTRIYPRYKSHGEFNLAVKRFSGWLSPHESDDLDVILLGHSMGGIIAADVALLHQDKSAKRKHRILGIINYDTPFLGLHPHVVSTGLGSLFSSSDETLEEASSNAPGFESVYNDPTFNPPDPPPKYDPRWLNDRRLPERGLVGGVKNFVQKKIAEREAEKQGLGHSALKRLMAPVKFASGVNNYSELRRRYQRLRELEMAEDSPERIRFMNYYTSSTPRRKVKEKSSKNKNKEASVVPSVASSTSINRVGDEASPETVSIATSSSGDSGTYKNPKPRRFILLPSSHWKYHDNRGWHPVAMEDMDEVEAHMSMFLPNRPNYDYLVGDTVALVEQWIQNYLTQRLLKEQAEAT